MGIILANLKVVVRFRDNTCQLCIMTTPSVLAFPYLAIVSLLTQLLKHSRSSTTWFPQAEVLELVDQISHPQHSFPNTFFLMFYLFIFDGTEPSLLCKGFL